MHYDFVQHTILSWPIGHVWLFPLSDFRHSPRTDRPLFRAAARCSEDGSFSLPSHARLALAYSLLLTLSMFQDIMESCL